MKISLSLAIVVLLLVTAGCSSTEKLIVGPKQGEKWSAIHLLGYETDNDLTELGKIIPSLDSMGINVVILEVDYNFEFQSHPELRRGKEQVTKEGAREFAEVCRKNDIKLITEFQCLGHQSWAEETFPLLTQYPQFDLTPGAFPGNKDIYCREWDLMNPEVNKIVFELLDEIIDAFQVDAFHVGMDEVFLLGSEFSPSTKGKNPGELYAKAINDIYNHLVKERGVEMLMWGDRLFDGKDLEFGEWESSLNGTASAVDMIPKDIIICPWHYENMPAYPSLPMFIEKGFRVLSTSWRDVEAAKSLINYSNEIKSPSMLGHLFTMWGRADVLKFPTLVECINLTK
ncbi:MAG: hypothetical protein A2068_01415 [Ignavibacteria bacterium GWB2_35_6b]|nr:MAG: hypothetical protein A2068_01415 [Ignavibacteria bacterium GWB2_35_6b]